MAGSFVPRWQVLEAALYAMADLISIQDMLKLLIVVRSNI